MRREVQPHEGLPSKIELSSPTARTWRHHWAFWCTRCATLPREGNGDLAKKNRTVLSSRNGPTSQPAAMGGIHPVERCYKPDVSPASTLQIAPSAVHWHQPAGTKCGRCREDRQSPQHSSRTMKRLSGETVRTVVKKTVKRLSWKLSLETNREDGGYWSNLWIKDLRVCKQNLDSPLYSLIVVALRLIERDFE
jgi:hypothetical protein